MIFPDEISLPSITYTVLSSWSGVRPGAQVHVAGGEGLDTGSRRSFLEGVIIIICVLSEK